MYVLLASCLLALHVVQLHAGNVQPNTEPLTVEIEGPQAALLGQTVKCTASPSGGSEEYTSYQWNIDGQDKGTGASLDYTVPAGDGAAKEVTVKCTVTDNEGESEPGEIQFWQVKFDLDVDANYDGTIDGNDENVETSQGGLIALNDDDDNRSGQADVSETAVQNENDLCLVTLTLAPANIAGSTLTLSAPAGGSRMRVWSTATKSGTPLSLPYEWQPGAQPQQVYVEGISPSANLRDCGLKLSFAKETTTLNDEITLGVVTVEFENRSDTAYGFDDGSLAYPAPVPRDYSPQKYSWVSVQNGNGQTKIDAKIIPAVYANSVFFTVDDTAKAVCSPARAATSPQLLTLTGKGSAPKTDTFLRANLGSANGPLVGRLNMAVYKNARLANRANITFYKIRTATLIPDGTTWGQLTNGANAFLARGVAYLDGEDGGTRTVEYDLNTNGYLDIDTTLNDGGAEWKAVTDAIRAASGNRYCFHVHPTIQAKIGTQWMSCAGLYYPQSGWESIIVTDICTPSKAHTLAHEALHHLYLKDVGPQGRNTRNIMYFQEGTFREAVGYFPVQRHYESGTENQWETIYRGY